MIFTALLGNNTVSIGARSVKESTYYVAAMAAFGVVTACFKNMAIATAFLRETGVLKRVDGTPMPPLSYVAARILHLLAVAVVLVAVTVVFGRAAYSVALPGGTTLIEFVVMLVVGAAAFCALGLALSAAIPNADAAAPMSTPSSCPCCSCRGYSSRSATPPRPGYSGRPGCSRCATSPPACRPSSSAPPSTGSTSRSSPRGGVRPRPGRALLLLGAPPLNRASGAATPPGGPRRGVADRLTFTPCEGS